MDSRDEFSTSSATARGRTRHPLDRLFEGMPADLSLVRNRNRKRVIPSRHRDALCKQCGNCMAACTEKAISFNPDGKGIVIDRNLAITARMHQSLHRRRVDHAWQGLYTGRGLRGGETG